jgi:DNA-binding transcriptional MerR regulator
MTSTPLDRHRQRQLTLNALTDAVRDVLGRAPAPDDGRVARFPDERTIRYYQTLGLIGRPLRYEGREALYGFEHLVRVVAVKLLQNQGFSLAQVQVALASTDVHKLEAAVIETMAASDGNRGAGKAATRATSPPPPTATPTTPMQSTLPAPRSVVQAEVAAGIQVTIDPAIVADPARALRAIRAALRRPINEGDSR